MSSSLTPVRVMFFTAAVLAVLALAWTLIQIVSVMVVLFLGIVLGAAIEPVVYQLRRRGLSRAQSILIVYACLIFIVSMAIYLIFPQLLRQGGDLVANIPEILVNIRNLARGSENEFVRGTGVNTINRVIQVYEEFQRNPPFEAGTAIQFATGTVGILFNIVTVLIVGFYWMTEKAIIKRVALGFISIQRRDRAHSIWDSVEAKIGGWIRGQAILCLIIGVLSTILYSPLFLDLPFWLALGIWAGATEIIPFIGPFLGGGAATMVALADVNGGGFQKAIMVVISVTVLQQLESAVLVPRIMKNAVGLTPLTVVLAVLVGSSVAGPLGAILAIPIAATVQVLLQDLLATREEAPAEVVPVLQAGPTLAARPPPQPAPAPAPGSSATAAHRRVAHQRRLRRAHRAMKEPEGFATTPERAPGD